MASRAWLFTLAAACRPSEEAPVPIDVCGQDAPVQILELTDDQAIMPGTGGSARFGERWLFGVRTFEIPLTKLETALSAAPYRLYDQIDATIVAVGECGEDRRIVLEGADIVQAPVAADGPWLACREDTADLFWFDPDGVVPPRQLSRASTCAGVLVRGRDAFVLRADTRELVRARLEPTNFAVETLVDDVIVAPHAQEPPSRDEPVPDDVFVIRGDRTLVRVDLDTGATQVELEDVGSFSISTDRRWLAWTSRPPDDMPSAAWLLDRHTGDVQALGRASWAFVSVVVRDDYAAAWGGNEDGSERELQLVAVPSLRSEWVVGDSIPLASSGDHVLLTSPESNYDALVIDLSTGVRTTLPDVGYVQIEEDALSFADHDRYADLGLPEALIPYDLVRIPLTTLEREVVRSRVFSRFGTAEDRWVIQSEIDVNFNVGLELLDGATLAHDTFASDVVPGSCTSNVPYTTDSELFPVLDVIYQVHERASDRGGIWRARLTP